MAYTFILHGLNQDAIEQHEKQMMARDGGHLTKADQEKLNNKLNHQSRAIYNARHKR